MKQILQLCGKLGLQLCCVLLIGCGGGKSASWQEEVELSDHRVIAISRKESWSVYRQFGESPSYQPDSQHLVVELSKERVEWSGRAEGPLLLDVDPRTGEYVLVVLPYGCVRYADFGKPKPPYVEYRLRNGTWQQAASLSHALIGRKPNLLMFPNWDGESPTVTLQMKQQRNAARIDILAYKMIVADGGLSGC